MTTASRIAAPMIDASWPNPADTHAHYGMIMFPDNVRYSAMCATAIAQEYSLHGSDLAHWPRTLAAVLAVSRLEDDSGAVRSRVANLGGRVAPP
jgi:hypothetical protein